MNSVSQSADPTHPIPTPEVLEEYKIISESIATVSDRRQRVNDVYVTINALFLSGVGILLISSKFTSWEVSVEVGVISLVVIPINVSWIMSVLTYRKVLSTHYQCLDDIESRYQLVANLSTRLGKMNTILGPARTRVGSGTTISSYFLVLYPLITLVVATITYLTINHLGPLG